MKVVKEGTGYVCVVFFLNVGGEKKRRKGKKKLGGVARSYLWGIDEIMRRKQKGETRKRWEKGVDAKDKSSYSIRTLFPKSC